MSERIPRRRPSARARRQEATRKAIWLSALVAVSALFLPLLAERLSAGRPGELLEVTLPVEGLH